MMRPTLATADGAQVVPVFPGPRFVSQGGTIRDQSLPNMVMTLADAEEGVALYRRDAADPANGRICERFAEWADQLTAAIMECKRQRRELGWTDPHALDRQMARREGRK